MQLSLFDQRDLAEIASPDYPGERLVVCRNPDLAALRARKRAALLAATEQDLARIRAATARARRPLRGQDAIALRVGAVLGRRKVAKHFSLTITDQTLTFARDEAAIAKEAALDGSAPAPGLDPGVVRTSLPAATLDAAATGSAYKSLAQVERDPGSRLDLDMYSPAGATADVPRLPLNLLDALRAFEADEMLCAGLGEDFARAYLKLRTAEWTSYAAHLTDWERHHTLDV